MGASLASLEHRRDTGESLQSYTASVKEMVKVLVFIESGGPILTIDRTVFELWLGDL